MINLEMNFTNRLTPELRSPIFVTSDLSERIFSDDSGSLLRLLADHNLVRPMDFVIRKHTILQRKPSRAPTFAVIHPLIQNTRNSITYNIVDLQVPLIAAARRLRRCGGHRRSHHPLAQPTGIVIVYMLRQIGSDGSGGNLRRHLRKIYRVPVVYGGDAAKRMHNQAVTATVGSLDRRSAKTLAIRRKNRLKLFILFREKVSREREREREITSGNRLGEICVHIGAVMCG